MFYRSDWPEAGLPHPLTGSSHSGAAGEPVRKFEFQGAELRWIIRDNLFETGFYGFPVRELTVEVHDPEKGILPAGLGSQELHREFRMESEAVTRCLCQGEGYLYAKVVPDEPLFCALKELGFLEVERRRLFSCSFGELQSPLDRGVPGGEIVFTTLSELIDIPERESRQQILDLCREAFSQGYTRHYIDDFLSLKRPGKEYILALMELNFRNTSPEGFLVAVDRKAQVICGVSVVGRKAGGARPFYSQLLSAVSRRYQGQGVYRGLTRLAAGIFPHNAVLLNVTHVENRKIQRAYQGSGRRHVADTVILRRPEG